MTVKEESEKVGLKHNIQKTPKIMASSLITSWQIDGETMERVIDFIFLGSKITADADCSHEIKRHLLLGRKDMAKPQRQKYRSMEQNRKPRDKSTNLWSPYLRQRRQGYTMEKRQPL